MLFIICIKVLGKYSAVFEKSTSNYEFELSNETDRNTKKDIFDNLNSHDDYSASYWHM